MRLAILGFLLCCIHCTALANDGTTLSSVRSRFNEYLAAFNESDADRVGSFWTADAVSVDSGTGERTIGREALVASLKEFFAESPGAKLAGEVQHARLPRPGVAIVDGVTTLFVPGSDPIESAFSAVLVDDDGWLIANSEERDVPTPETPRHALEQLAWLVGEWRDETDDASVSTAVRWSTNEAFLIRSYRAEFVDAPAVEGTQVIGWDALAKQFRTWTFDSDGSFGEGTASKDGEDWLLRMSHVSADGVASSYTQLFSRVDEDTLRVQKFGQTVDGAPVPNGDPVTVVRVEADSPATVQAGGQ